MSNKTRYASIVYPKARELSPCRPFSSQPTLRQMNTLHLRVSERQQSSALDHIAILTTLGEIIPIHLALGVILWYRAMIEVSLDMPGNAERRHRIRAMPICHILDDLRPDKYVPSDECSHDWAYRVVAGGQDEQGVSGLNPLLRHEVVGARDDPPVCVRISWTAHYEMMKREKIAGLEQFLLLSAKEPGHVHPREDAPVRDAQDLVNHILPSLRPVLRPRLGVVERHEAIGLANAGEDIRAAVFHPDVRRVAFQEFGQLLCHGDPSLFRGV